MLRTDCIFKEYSKNWDWRPVSEEPGPPRGLSRTRKLHWLNSTVPRNNGVCSNLVRAGRCDFTKETNSMKLRMITSVFALAVLSVSTICAADSPEEKQAKIRAGCCANAPGSLQAGTRRSGRHSKSCWIRRLQELRDKPARGEHGERLRHCHQQSDQAGNLHEDDLGRRRAGRGSEGLPCHLCVYDR